MSYISEILDFNQEFVNQQQHTTYLTDKYPDKKIAILTCMDTRLTQLLPAALNLKNGAVKIVKNAGAVITNPFGSVMRSLLIAVYELGVEEIMVIAHYDCGMHGLEGDVFIQKIKQQIPEKTLNVLSFCGVDLNRWLTGFSDIKKSVQNTVQLIQQHPLMPEMVNVYGFIIDPVTGKLDLVLTEKK